MTDTSAAAHGTGTASDARNDLRVEPLAIASKTEWNDPESSILQLYRSAEERAIRSVEWYLADKKSKRRASRLLRGLAIVLAAAGGIYPLIVTGQGISWSPNWGYVLIALAAACVAFDRFFGLSSAWMRDMASVNSINARLLRLQLDWTDALIPGPTDSERILHRVALLRIFAQDIAEEINKESVAWRMEFSAQISEFDNRTLTTRHPADSSELIRYPD